jgi:protein gp37
MGKNSKIEWTHHTFNPWWGCVKVSEACKHCYAEAWAKRVGKKVWGPKSERRFLSDAHWRQPIAWDREAKRSGERHRVFCASMADVFEDRDDLIEARARLGALIEATPNLDWLVLTKRPQNAVRLSPWAGDWPLNVWAGTTVELQHRAEELLPYLDQIPASVRFISAEPLLGPLELGSWLGSTINWVITGGESGPKARPASPSWFTGIHRQCMEAEVAFHFKQWGDWAPGDGINLETARKKANVATADDGTRMIRVGKKAAGRVLKGSEWDELPRMRVN